MRWLIFATWRTQTRTLEHTPMTHVPHQLSYIYIYMKGDGCNVKSVKKLDFFYKCAFLLLH